ncbi:MAG: hypothetical protein ACOC45_04115 [Alkalispirochaetaceae bacterium]
MSLAGRFTAEVREINRRYLEAMAAETETVFAQSFPSSEDGAVLFRELQHQMPLESAQQACITILRFLDGGYDDGSFVFTDPEFQGLKLLRDKYETSIDPGEFGKLDEMIRILEKSTPPE